MIELGPRATRVLIEMRRLSEVSAANVDGDMISGGGAESAPPPGVNFDRIDLRDLSLADYWFERFRAAGDDPRRLQTCVFLAERDLARALRRQPPIDPHETPAARDARVSAEYAGMDALEAALAEGCSPSWIRLTRHRLNLNPQTGEPLGPVPVPASGLKLDERPSSPRDSDDQAPARTARKAQ